MFGCVANSTQHLDVVWVCALHRMLRMRFDMVSLKIFCVATFFTFAAFFNNICNNTARFICSFGRSVVPFWMVWARQFSSSSNSQARSRTIVSSTTVSFSGLKFFSTLFTSMVKHSFALRWFNFVRAFFRASVCFAAIVGFKYLKFFCASRADKSNLSPSVNFSNGVCHG